MTTQHLSADAGSLIAAAGAGDERAWQALIERYAPLVASVIRAYRLDRADAADVNQTVWLRLVEHLDRIREPAALAGWLATTTRRECYRVLRTGRPLLAFDPYGDGFEPPAGTADSPDEQVLRAERNHALREAFALLPPRCRHLLAMALADPAPSYREIGERLGMAVGSVGPTQARCLRRLRDCPALAALVEGADAGSTTRDTAPTGGDRDDIMAARR